MAGIYAIGSMRRMTIELKSVRCLEFAPYSQIPWQSSLRTSSPILQIARDKKILDCPQCCQVETPCLCIIHRITIYKLIAMHSTYICYLLGVHNMQRVILVYVM